MENISYLEQNVHQFSHNQNDINCINAENISPNITSYLLNNEDILTNYSLNSSFTYEAIQNNESEETSDENNITSNSHRDNTNDFCVNDCEERIKRLSSDNEKLDKKVIQLEEQIAELIKDKQKLDSDLNAIKESFDRKLGSKNKDIEELTNSLLIFESLNASLEEKLEQRLEEKIKLELHIKEIEDKLYYSETQLSESQKSEEDLLMSYKNARKAFSEEENIKYKAIEQLHKVYIECATQQNEIIELKEQVSILKREIADKDNELWFYKSRTVDSCLHCAHNSERHLDRIIKESLCLSRTSSEIPEYSFSVNDDDWDYTYDFNDENLSKQSDESFTCVENSLELEKKDHPFIFKMFNGLLHCLLYFIFRLPFKLILAITLIVISVKVLFASIFPTNLPAYTSWEEISYRVLVPYITKVKVSRTQ